MSPAPNLVGMPKSADLERVLAKITEREPRLALAAYGPRSRGRLAAQGCCQRALMIFHPSRVRTRWRYST